MKRRQFHRFLAASLLSVPAMPRLASAAPDRAEMPRRLVKPPRLKVGDTIGLIAPSSPISENRLQKAISNIEGMGFKVKTGNSVLSRYGYLAGTDQERIRDIHAMFADDTVSGIWCVRGGYGAGRLLPDLNYDLIRNNPKVFIGYSDVTALLQAFHLKTGLVCFHGPVANSEFSPYTLEHVRNLLMNPVPVYPIPPCSDNVVADKYGYFSEVIAPGTARGRLTGGNLSLLASLTGTDFEWYPKDRLLFIEDIEERPYRIDRMLTQLLLTGELAKASGIMLGIFEKCQPEPREDSLSLIETLRDRLGCLDIPVLYGMSFGHIAHQFTLPLGIEAQLDTSAQILSLLESAVV